MVQWAGVGLMGRPNPRYAAPPAIFLKKRFNLSPEIRRKGIKIAAKSKKRFKMSPFYFQMVHLGG